MSKSVGGLEHEVGKPSLSGEKLGQLYQEIRDVYLADGRPWVIGYSGGKDSTTALQLVWMALKALPEAQRAKPVFVISSDTLVESPIVAQKILDIHKKINAASALAGLPFQAHMVYPKPSETFWVNMIGKGYPVLEATLGGRLMAGIAGRLPDKEKPARRPASIRKVGSLAPSHARMLAVGR